MEIYNDTYCVYMHTNNINGKKYVGMTCQKPEKRWNSGKGYINNVYFYSAIQKYGWDNFEHDVIASNLTKEEADNFEKLLIKELNLLNPNNGYNLKDGGANSRPSEISRVNIKNAAIKRCQNEEYIKRQSEAHKWQTGANNPMHGKKHTEETKQKLREISSGKHPSNETKNKMSESHIGEKNPMFGKSHLDETKKKISDLNKGATNPKAKKVSQYTLDGILIKTWDYIKQAAENLGIPPQNISRCCRTCKGTAGGFQWSYAD